MHEEEEQKVGKEEGRQKEGGRRKEEEGGRQGGGRQANGTHPDSSQRSAESPRPNTCPHLDLALLRPLTCNTEQETHAIKHIRRTEHSQLVK